MVSRCNIKECEMVQDGGLVLCDNAKGVGSTR